MKLPQKKSLRVQIMPEVSGISLSSPLSGPCVAPHENLNWSSVGIFKGPSIRRPRQCLFTHILHAGPRLGS